MDAVYPEINKRQSRNLSGNILYDIKTLWLELVIACERLLCWSVIGFQFSHIILLDVLLWHWHCQTRSRQARSRQVKSSQVKSTRTSRLMDKCGVTAWHPIGGLLWTNLGIVVKCLFVQYRFFFLIRMTQVTVKKILSWPGSVRDYCLPNKEQRVISWLPIQSQRRERKKKEKRETPWIN